MIMRCFSWKNRGGIWGGQSNFRGGQCHPIGHAPGTVWNDFLNCNAPAVLFSMLFLWREWELGQGFTIFHHRSNLTHLRLCLVSMTIKTILDIVKS
uniref:Uncharacterized protein n=1 Tax=Anguilla anguilla TaxID=7936 RepID=A0A0E9XPI8_ANGAN